MFMIALQEKNLLIVEIQAKLYKIQILENYTSLESIYCLPVESKEIPTGRGKQQKLN